jgi:hypothetical protein
MESLDLGYLIQGMASTVDLLFKIGCFVKKKNIVSVRKAADLN